MRYPEEELIAALRESGVDFTASLPCEKIKSLLVMVAERFPHVPLTREEEGVGICAGAALAGRRPALFLQSSGIGNMINALLSLTSFYELPLALFISRRGVYREQIQAQLPMGKGLPKLLRGAGIPFTLIEARSDLGRIRKRLDEVYRKDRLHAFLMSPAVWEGSCSLEPPAALCPVAHAAARPKTGHQRPRLTRFGVLETIAPFLEGRVVVCNLGFPSKELFHIKHQPSHFYMLGSMGMTTPIGLGISLATDREVVVIDGDGSILMNPGTLATAAAFGRPNLTIVCIDNGSYGSTGSQPTLTGACVDLEMVARGFGFRQTAKVAGKQEIRDIMRKKADRVRFIHILALPGNRNVPPIPLDHFTIKKAVIAYLAGK